LKPAPTFLSKWNGSPAGLAQQKTGSALRQPSGINPALLRSSTGRQRGGWDEFTSRWRRQPAQNPGISRASSRRQWAKSWHVEHAQCLGISAMNGNTSHRSRDMETLRVRPSAPWSAKFGLLNLRDGEVFRNVALYNVPEQLQAVRLNEVIRPHPQSGFARLIRTRQVVHIDDLTTTPAYRKADPVVKSTADLGGRAHACPRPDAKGARAVRHVRHLPHRSAAVRRQADRRRQLAYRRCWRPSCSRR
jgi:hypothetical protein